MALPGKKRGFRKIVINGVDFSWRFISKIEVCPTANKANKLVVDFGWRDPWLHFGDRSNDDSTNNPEIVTPAFVRKVIEFALHQHWDVNANAGVTEIIYKHQPGPY